MHWALVGSDQTGQADWNDSLVRNWVTSRPDFTVTTYLVIPQVFHPVTANSSITTEVHRDLSPIQIFQTPTSHWKPRTGKILGLPFHCQSTQFCFISFLMGTPWNRIFFVGKIQSWPSIWLALKPSKMKPAREPGFIYLKHWLKRPGSTKNT